ncbi:MAG: aspartate aminotransferase family protein [Acidimicrobiia bacterium]|nr:aspartate aminotransferase family protein [Acidimicrobiia bacterium]
MASAFLHPFAKPTKSDFITLVRGQGAVVYDDRGNEYVDGMASLWYCAVGHGRSDIADAIGRQARTLAAYSTFDPFTNAPAEQLAEVLVDIAPMADSRVFFTSSGSEAVDTAMKLSRLAHIQAGHPERTLIISRQRGYHGTAYGGTSAQGIAPNREGYAPYVGDVVQVPADDVEALASLMSERASTIAAVLVEPIQGAGGVFPPSEGYLESVRRLCDQHGAHLIYDEVISGFGRLGHWFAAHRYGVRPDMVTFAKAVTSGYQPLGGESEGDHLTPIPQLVGAIGRHVQKIGDHLERNGKSQFVDEFESAACRRTIEDSIDQLHDSWSESLDGGGSERLAYQATQSSVVRRVEVENGLGAVATAPPVSLGARQGVGGLVGVGLDVTTEVVAAQGVRDVFVTRENDGVSGAVHGIVLA